MAFHFCFIQVNEQSLGFALTKPHLKLRCFFSPCTFLFIIPPTQEGGVLSSFTNRWLAPRVTVPLATCGLLVAQQTLLMYRPWLWFWNPDKKNGKDNDRGLCVVYFIFLSLLACVPFVVWSHARTGSLFWWHATLRSRLLSRRRRAVLCMRLLCLARPMWCKSCWLQVRGRQHSCLHSMPGLGLFLPSLPGGGFFLAAFEPNVRMSPLIANVRIVHE